MSGFKNLLSIIIVLCLVCTPLLSLNTSKIYGANEEIKYGDIDSDGDVNSIDLAILTRYILGLIDGSKINLKTVDLNGDKEVDTIDYTLLKRYVLRLIDEFPVEKMNPDPSTASNKEDLKDALVYNFNKLGTSYSIIYKGDISNLSDIITIAISDAIKESTKPFILENVSFNTSGVVGNLEIKFEFSYNHNYSDNYSDVACSKSDLESILLSKLKNRTENINIIYKDTIELNEIDEILDILMSNDTYLASSINNTMYQFSSSLGISAIDLVIDYCTTKEQEDYVDETVNSIVSKLVNDDMSDHEKEKLIHDYILYFVEYSDSDDYNDPYSALYHGKTKCNGYAMLTYKMLTAAGIENVIATNEDHAWNIVNIEGNWYHLDTTWNDGKEKGYGFYGYYNLTDEQLILGPDELDGRNYAGIDGISCTTNYIELLEAINDENDGKYEHILRDLEENEYYVEIKIKYIN